MVQKILSGQTFPADLNPHCDFDLEECNPKLSYNTPARDDAPLYQIGMQKVTKFRRYGTNIYLFRTDLSPHCDLHLEDRNLTFQFSHGTSGHDDEASYQVWLHTVYWFRRYLPDKICSRQRCDTQAHAQTT